MSLGYGEKNPNGLSCTTGSRRLRPKIFEIVILDGYRLKRWIEFDSPRQMLFTGIYTPLYAAVARKVEMTVASLGKRPRASKSVFSASATPLKG
jgi:hypothetical protein